MKKDSKNSKQTPLIPVHSLNHSELEILIGDVIHKVKNNLGGMSGFATLLERDLGEESPHLRLIEQIQSSVMRLDDLVVDLMVLIRKVKPTWHDVPVHPLLSNIILQYEERHQLKCKISYSEKIKSDRYCIHADDFVLERIFLYLIRFVENMNGILKEICIENVKEKSTRFVVKIDHLDLDHQENTSIAKLMTEHESVEARLAFAILIKLVEALNGHLDAKYESNTNMDLLIEFAEGKTR